MDEEDYAELFQMLQLAKQVSDKMDEKYGSEVFCAYTEQIVEALESGKPFDAQGYTS